MTVGGGSIVPLSAAVHGKRRMGNGGIPGHRPPHESDAGCAALFSASAAEISGGRPILPLRDGDALADVRRRRGTDGATSRGMNGFVLSIRRLGLIGVGFVATSLVATLAATAGLLDPKSLMITVGGALGVTYATFPRARLRHAWALTGEALAAPADFEPLIATVKHLAHVHRIDGVPALERAAAHADEPFLRDAVALAVEARTEVELRESLVGDARRWATDGEAARQVLVTLGKLFPAFGLIGTLLGLVSLMRHLGGADLSVVGPGLGMAVLTTLYGAVFANVVVLPLNAKLQAHLIRRALVMQMVIEGTLLLHRREYPTRIERALRAYVGAGRPAPLQAASAAYAAAELRTEWNDDLLATERAA